MTSSRRSKNHVHTSSSAATVRRGRSGVAAVAIVAIAGVFVFSGALSAGGTEGGTEGGTDSRVAMLADTITTSANSRDDDRSALKRASIFDSLIGFSGKLRARFMTPSQSSAIPVLKELFGTYAVETPGTYTTTDEDIGTFHLITMRPFADKIGGRIGQYRIGVFPSERRRAGSNPTGFLEVTSSSQHTSVSENFRLSDFLTKDQHTVWPKYLVLKEPLLDKLELVIEELREMGVPVKKMKVMSGFRTPQYNARGVGAGGRASDSRHQYGDAADVYIVNGARDWMSDLNGDGKVDTRDARVVAEAAERVERKYPELVGGIGIYKATAAHGPFVHIDVRGQRARWGAM